ncbi:MAG TPA: isocitrate lyase/phosphoenolpyruvate mutase family protein [Candidatus Acidoferrales bacterium]|nr:isocitrate lyase/phosphoenolpyruvate mutase family protein [Candidatus Acidoferrales bacterium]
MKTQNEKAEFFASLHRGPEILVLPNAWDCASARIFEQAGFPAIATTSAGIAFSLGYSDGERIPQDLMLATVGQITDSVELPVTADLEAGYGDVAKTTAGLIAAGAVGLNLEDMDHDSQSLAPIPAQSEKIAMIRRIATGLGVNLVINARTDVFLAEIGEPAARFDRACERLQAYIAAGADCVFLPGVADENMIRRVVETLKFPLNILAGANLPTIPRLRQLGVARVSVGSGIMRATLGLTRRIAQELKQSGTYSALLEGTMPFAEANALFEA